MTRRKVRFTATAREQVRRFQRWWQENSERPEILDHDLAAAIAKLCIAPGIGSVYKGSPTSGVRRLYLERLTSHLYYTYDNHQVVIRGLWHARRGSGPDLG